MSFSRRNFLKASAAVTIGFGGLASLLSSSYRGNVLPSAGTGYGELLPDPEGIFNLPKGFSYQILSGTGNPMSDGFYVPGLPDGMAAFPGSDGLTILIINHEVNPASGNELGAFGKNNELLTNISKDLFFDYARGVKPALGGTSTLIYDTKTGKVVRQYLSLAGTLRNCAGGPTPWNTWLTCEETVIKKDDIYEQDHGYVFEVPASADAFPVKAVPIKGMGRFNHEAVAVHPSTSIVYLTEDAHDGLLYRYRPNIKGNLLAGGTLEALAVKGKPSFDSRNWENPAMAQGDILQTEWIALENIDPPEDDLRLRGFQSGAARFARGEGMWYGNDAVYFACTNGGAIKKGQIFRYIPSIYEGTPRETEQPGRLELFIESPSADLLENADNITIAPNGNLFICEDGPGSQFLVMVTPEGKISQFGKNVLNGSELTGCCFSPDGSTLFFNIQNPGITFAITGPW